MNLSGVVYTQVGFVAINDGQTFEGGETDKAVKI
jgi:hypothetical protein